MTDYIWPDIDGYTVFEPRHKAKPWVGLGPRKPKERGGDSWISCGQCDACFEMYHELCEKKTYF